MMTKREVFDKVKAHLLAQNAQAKSGIDCMYRGPEGTKCAAGCLIDDELYHPNMERRLCTADPVIGALVASGVPRELMLYDVPYCVPWGGYPTPFLRALQLIHDNGEPSDWPAALDKFEKMAFPEVSP